jgi:integrase
VGKHPLTGRRAYKSKTIQGTLAEANRLLAHEYSQVSTGTPGLMTVQMYLYSWLNGVISVTASPKTLRSYTTMLAHAFAAFGDVRLDKLESVDIQRLYMDLTGTLSPRTIRYLHTILKSALDRAVRSRLISVNPCRGPVVVPRMVYREPTVWSVEQATAFLAGVKDSSQYSRDYLLFYTLLHTGMRPSEALALQWRDVDGRRLGITRAIGEGTKVGTYVLKEPKTRQGRRSLVLTQEHARLLQAAREERGERADSEAFVFRLRASEDSKHPTHDNRMAVRLRFNNACAHLNKVREEAGLTPLPHIRLYDLRHVHATTLLRAGVHPKIVADRLGHANITVTLSVYSHVLPSMQDDAMGVYERMIETEGGTQ